MESENFEYLKSHTVDQVMSRPVVCAQENTPLTEIVDQLKEGPFSGIPVVDYQHHIVGIVTPLDVLCEARKGHDFSEVYARDVMTRDVVTAEKSSRLTALVKAFQDYGVNCIPVTDGGKLVGIVSRHDILSHLISHQPHIFKI